MLKPLRPTSEREQLTLEELKAKCQIVVLRNPYEMISNAQVTRLFGNIARFKIDSYRREYPYGILPFDGVDVVGTHFLLCEREGNDLLPMMGFKTVTAEQCRVFHLSHPIFGLLGNRSQHPGHFAQIEKILEDANTENKNLGYFGSWTIREDVRKNRMVRKICQELSAAMLVNACDHLGFDQAITVAVSRFNVETFHRFMGLEALESDGKPLSSFRSEAMMGDECSLSFLKDVTRLSADVRQLASKYGDFWNSRLELAAEAGMDQSIKKAA